MKIVGELKKMTGNVYALVPAVGVVSAIGITVAANCHAAADADLVAAASSMAGSAKENAIGISGEFYTPMLIVGIAVALVFFALKFGRKLFGR